MTRVRHFNRTLSVILAFIGASLSAPVFAQQPAAPPPPPPPPQEGTAEFAFVGTSGNSSTQAIGLGGEVTVRRAPWTYNGKVAYVHNKAEGELQAESFAGLFQVSRTLKPRLAAYGKYGYLRNTFAGIENRNSISGGLEYLVIQPEPHRLKVNAGIGYANEQRVIGEDLSTPEFLTGASYKWTISPTADLSDDYDFSVSFSDAGDWRNANIATLTAKLTTLFSLKLSNIVRYVHEPVFGFENTDTITSIAFVAKF
jgi:putative salt-induced outer membrane protein